VTREVFVLGGARTPRGKGSPKGALHALTPVQLVTHVLDAIAPRLAGAVDDVILGCTAPGDGGGNVARTATLAAGWDPAIPGVTINRYCTSGLDAVVQAASRIRATDASLIVAGGVESVSRVPAAAVTAAAGAIHMGVAADLVATLEGIGRDACDRYALASRTKAAQAWASGRYPSVVPLGTLAIDENVGYQPDLDELRALPTLFDRFDRPASLREITHVHTRGSSPSLADAAAVLVIGDDATTARARIVATATVGGDPITMLTAGQTAIERALARAGLRPRDLAFVQFAEAFAALCLRLARDLELDEDRLNPCGGTIALGHAFGATGAILLLDAIDELHRRGGRYAAVAVSGAAGLGSAVIIERA